MFFKHHILLQYIFPALASVFLVDPAANSSEEADSEDAAKRVMLVLNLDINYH